MPEEKSKSVKKEVLRFILSAGLGFGVNVGCFQLLHNYVFAKDVYRVYSYTMPNYTLSFTISFFTGVLVNFLMTRYIVFTESRSTFTKQFFRFFGVAIVGYFANRYLLVLLVKYWGLYPTLGVVLAGLTLFVASFFIHKVFSFSISLKRRHASTNSSTGN
jgi:putative flippase GtrA